MYDRTKIDTMYGVVGWNQPFNPDYDDLDADNLVSRSGLKIDKVSAFAKIAYIKETQDYAGISVDNFNLELKRLQINAIIDTLDDVYREPDILESKPLFSDSPDIFTDRGEAGKFVGYEIRLREKANIALQINKAWLYFAETGQIKLLLFNQFKQAILESETINVVANELTEKALNWTIYLSGSIMSGRYYLGYLTTGTPLSKDGTRCANTFDNIQICEGEVNKTTETTIDPQEFEGSGLDYGLNFDFSVKKDVSESMIRNELTIAKAVALKVATKAVEMYVATLRSGPEQRIATNEETIRKLLLELHGDTEHKIWGLHHKYAAEIKKIRQSFTCYGNVLNVESQV